MGDEYKGKSLVDSGASIIGGAAGSVVGTWLGGPGAATLTGAAVGATLGEVVKKGIGEFASRVLSKREQLRVEATAKHAVNKIQSLLDQGFIPRRDSFFDEDDTGRS